MNFQVLEDFKQITKIILQKLARMQNIEEKVPNALNLDNENYYDSINWETITVSVLQKILNGVPDSVLKSNIILYSACKNNANLSIIKFLVEEPEGEISNERILQKTENCVTLACAGNKNADVMEYLLKNTKDHNFKHDIILKNCKNITKKYEDGLELISDLDYQNNIEVIKVLLKDARIYRHISGFAKYNFLEILCIKERYFGLNSLLYEGYIKMDDLDVHWVGPLTLSFFDKIGYTKIIERVNYAQNYGYGLDYGYELIDTLFKKKLKGPLLNAKKSALIAMLLPFEDIKKLEEQGIIFEKPRFKNDMSGLYDIDIAQNTLGLFISKLKINGENYYLPNEILEKSFDMKNNTIFKGLDNIISVSRETIITLLTMAFNKNLTKLSIMTVTELYELLILIKRFLPTFITKENIEHYLCNRLSEETIDTIMYKKIMGIADDLRMKYLYITLKDLHQKRKITEIVPEIKESKNDNKDEEDEKEDDKELVNQTKKLENDILNLTDENNEKSFINTSKNVENDLQRKIYKNVEIGKIKIEQAEIFIKEMGDYNMSADKKNIFDKICRDFINDLMTCEIFFVIMDQFKKSSSE